MATRREFAMLLLASVFCLPTAVAHASDGDSGSGGGGSGSGGGSSGSGGGGSGGGSSGSGGGSSGSGDGDSGGDDSDSDNSGSGSSNSGSGDDGDDDENEDHDGDDEQTKARKAVERGDAIALRKVLKSVSKQYPGRVVSVRLSGKGRSLRYSIRVIDKNNRLLNLVVNARTGQINAGTSN